MLKVLLHPPASEEDDVVKKQQVNQISVLAVTHRFVSLTVPHRAFQLRELALMNGTFKEHPSERAARMHPGRGAGSSGGHGGGGGHDWQGGGAAAAAAYADPAVMAYNRVRIAPPLAEPQPCPLAAC